MFGDNLEKRLETRIIKADGEPMDWVEHETNSIVQAFGNILFTQFAGGANSPQIEDIKGDSIEVANSGNNFNIVNSSQTDGEGIHFGTGNAGVQYNDTDLDDRFTSGVSYNQGSASITQSLGQTDIEVERTISNDRTTAIVASEAGQIARVDNVSGGDNKVLVARDDLGTGVTIEPTESLVGRYTWVFGG